MACVAPRECVLLCARTAKIMLSTRAVEKTTCLYNISYVYRIYICVGARRKHPRGAECAAKLMENLERDLFSFRECQGLDSIRNCIYSCVL